MLQQYKTSHRVGDLIRNNSVYGNGETGIIIDLKDRPHGEYDILVKWTGQSLPEWHCIDPRAKPYMKILARGKFYERL